MKYLFVMALAFILSVSTSAQSISSGMINLDCTMDVELTKGYTHAKIFFLNGEQFFFSHNSNTGATDVWNLDKGGNAVLSANWSSGWTNINFYEYKGEVYFFHQIEAIGLARINRLVYEDIMSGSKMGEQVFEANWSKGWTNTLFFSHNDILYFLHYKARTGLARLNASQDGSSVGTKIYEKTWSKGWTGIDIFYRDGKPQLMHQKESTGQTRICELKF